MSRSNGSQPLPAGQVPQASGYDVNPDPRAWNPQQPAPQQAQQAAPQYQVQPQQRPAEQGYGTQAHPGYADPYAQQGGYYQAPAQQPAYAAAAPQVAARPAAQLSAAGYAPQFDPYVATPAYQPAASQPASAAYPDLRGSAYEHPAYDQWSGQPQQADPRAYDLANYGAHDQSQAYANQQQAQPVAHQPAAPAARAQASTDWGQQQQSAQYAQQTYDPYQQAAMQGGPAPAGQQDYGLSAAQHDQGQGGYNEAYADGEAMEDEAPRGRRGFMIAATLAGAIFVGGGLTYAYNSLLGSGTGGPPPLVKSASGPSKVKPSDPGGKQFAHADSKVLGRLNDNGTSNDLDASGSKKVPTLVVKPDGTIEPPAMTEQVAAPAPAAEPAMAAVPGLSVISVGGAQPAAAVGLAPVAVAEKAVAPVVAEAKQAVQAVANAVQKPLVVAPPAAVAAAPTVAPPAVAPPAVAPKAPVVISSAATAAANAASSLVETAAVEPSAVAAPAVKKPAAVIKKVAALAAPGAAAPAAVAATAAPSSGAGYMAVVASVPASAKSRMDALTQWADMQQKFGTILQGKTMDVQEAKVADKGLYHRLLVGPPSSKDTANSICSQLKAAGHADCWVMGY